MVAIAGKCQWAINARLQNPYKKGVMRHFRQLNHNPHLQNVKTFPIFVQLHFVYAIYNV
jgi:hypothetical protein